ncbi:MAG TPA: hypothetical protein PK760_13205, partial [Flavobacteriales bacterium]|nr:hypothetical protein [Flavobacteriales bacterium]
MSEAAEKSIRLSKVAKEFNLALHTVVEFLDKKGHKVESNPNAKIDGVLYELLLTQFGSDKEIKAQSQQVVQQRQERETILLTAAPAKVEPKPKPKEEAEVLIHNVQPAAPVPPAPVVPEPPAPAAAPAEPEVIKAKAEKAVGPKTLGKIDLDSPKKKKATKAEPVAEAPAAAPVAPAPVAPVAPEAPAEPETIRVNVTKLAGVKQLGKIELPVEKERKPT